MPSTVDLSTVTDAQRAQIIREERDYLIMRWQNGVINDLLGAERILNSRIRALGVEDTMTGDTTEDVPA